MSGPASIGGRTLFVGDVHGCAAELEQLLTLAAADRIVLLGDLFTKGPDPAGVWDLVQRCGCEAILGNHDVALLDRVRKRGRKKRDLPDAALAWLDSLPLWLEGEGPDGPWFCVHAGVEPSGPPQATPRRRALNLRRLPDDSDPDNPFWWEHWSGPPLVLYGHDAVRGLVDRRPHSLGLDTGCVYGGVLTGYLLEERRLLQVPAAAVYKPVGRKASR